jgi:MEMO1 family protein
MNRPSFLAGQWYPGTETACRKAIEGHAATAKVEQGPYRGLIGPHAGWFFSGNAAGQAYAWLSAARPAPDLVVIFGSHRGPHGPNTVFCADGWETPVGVLKTAVPLAAEIKQALGLKEEPVSPSHPDNAVELHLPFVRHFFPEAELLMLGVAAADEALGIGDEVGRLVRDRRRDAVFVGSTDLTHYGPNYGFAPAGHGEAGVRWVRETNDRGFIDAVLAGAPAAVVRHGVDEQSACCPGAVAATMSAIQAYGATAAPKLVDNYLSYDIQPGSSFVGYAAILL